MIIDLYADGGVISANPSPYGGTWAYRVVDAHSGQVLYDNSGWVLSRCGFHGTTISNNVTELLALVQGLECVQSAYIHARLTTVYSDSLITLLRVFFVAKLNGVPPWLVQRLQAIQKSGLLCNVRHVLLSGHPTKAQLATGIGKGGRPVSAHNVWCDQACTYQAREAQQTTEGVAA